MEDHQGELAGRTIVVTGQRKADELAGSLERRGASVVHAPVLVNVPVADDADLLDATRSLLQDPPDVVVVTTGVGFRGWLEAADGAGLGEALRGALAGARILARGAKARGAVVGAGLSCDWVAESEQASEIRALLEEEASVGRGVTGRRVAVQHHGSGADGLDELVSELGAEVVSLVVYRWAPSPDPDAVTRAVRAVADHRVDGVVFTAAPGVAAFLAAASELGLREQVVAAFRGPVLAATVGPVTAAPLEAEGITPLVPERWRLGSLVRELTEHWSASA